MRLRGPRSLLGQIGLVHLATIVVVALTLPLAISLMLRQTAAQYQGELLMRQAAVLRAHLRFDRDHWEIDLDPALAALYAAGSEGRAFLLVGPDGQARIESARANAALLARAPLDDRSHGFSFGPILGRVDPIGPPQGARSGGGWLVVSQDINDPGVVTDDIVRAFLSRFLWLLLPVLAWLPIANLALIRRSTQAVKALSSRAAQIGPATLDMRLPTRRLPSEVEPLAVATNNALDRLELGFRSQSEFIANVAHELRTPLSTLRLRLDAVDDPALVAAMHRTLDQASHVITQLLDLASLEGLAIAADEHLDPVAVAQAAIEDAAPAVYAGGRTIGLVAPDAPARVCGRAPLVALALANLIDNALRHTPAGTNILVEVDADGGVTVADDGPGIPDRNLPALTQRFRRGEQAREQGSGIGLSIVERILEAHGTALEIGNGATGGARFRFRLGQVASAR